MSIFNDNLRFMCKKMGLSQQKLADQLDVPRGRVAGYFYQTQAKPDFQQKLSDQFHLDLGRFLTVEMDELNYPSFFLTNTFALAKEPRTFYGKSGIIDVLVAAKHSDDKLERDKLIDEAIIQSGRLIEENSQLKDQLVEAIKKRE